MGDEIAWPNLVAIDLRSQKAMSEDDEPERDEVYGSAMDVPDLLAALKQLLGEAKWLFDDFAWEEHWRYCDLPEGNCETCNSLIEMKARYGWD